MRTYIASTLSIAALALLSGCEAPQPGSEAYERSVDQGYRTEDGRLRMPKVTALSTGRYLVTYPGGGVATYDEDGHLMSSSNLTSRDLNRAQSAVNLKRQSENR